MTKPRLTGKLKITSSAAREGCSDSALMRIRINRAVPGEDKVVKSGATEDGKLTLTLPCAPGTYYATATDYRGHTARSKPVKLTCKPGAASSVGTTLENEVVKLTNAERAKGGCRPLTHDPKVRAAAFAHSSEMARTGNMDHTSADGRQMQDRLKGVGRVSAMAENIAEGQRSAAEVMGSWMNSPGHRRNIMNCDYTHIGVGAVKSSGGRIFWTQDFIAR
ncbi:CAP domain-containing protein [Nonomuraea purpurea]|uniref:CAP domain-containing protein n=1 Tax=Nonomuraea purpurea TaxID=1849276 RepID=A0ABV8G948_9ACTN